MNEPEDPVPPPLPKARIVLIVTIALVGTVLGTLFTMRFDRPGRVQPIHQHHPNPPPGTNAPPVSR